MRLRPLIVLCIGILLFGGFAVYFAIHEIIASEHRQIIRNEQNLVYKANHQSIYNACTQIWNNQATFRKDPQWQNVPRSDHSRPDPNDPGMPLIIKSLGVSSINIESGTVQLEFGGGFYHYGVTAYLDPSKGKGIKQLISGLWYYSEEGIIPPLPGN